MTRTGGVGSIGVIAVHMDQSGWDEKMGRKYTAVYAGARKNDFSTHQPLSDDARANLQGEVDRLYEMFVASVSRNRGIPPALVRKTDAGLYWGEKAISAGLADQVGSFDDALAAVTQAAPAHRGKLAQRRLPRRRSKKEKKNLWLNQSKRNRQTLRLPPPRPLPKRNRCAGPGSLPPPRRLRRPLRNPSLLRLLLPPWTPPQSRRASVPSTRRSPRSARWLASPDSSRKRSRSA